MIGYPTDAIPVNTYIRQQFEKVAHEAGEKLASRRNLPTERVVTTALRIKSGWPNDHLVITEILRARVGLEGQAVVDELRGMQITDDDLGALVGPRWVSSMTVFAMSELLLGDELGKLNDLRGDDWKRASDAAAEVGRSLGLKYDISDSEGAERDWCAARGAAWAVAMHEHLEGHDFETLTEPWISLVRPKFVQLFMDNADRPSFVAQVYDELCSHSGGHAILSAADQRVDA